MVDKRTNYAKDIISLITETYGKIDWFWQWMCVGAPFGIAHLLVFVIPVNMDITSSLGVLFAQQVISGLFRGLIAAWTAVKAIYYLIIYPFIKLG